MKKDLEKFNELVEAFNKLPGIGKKSATRFAYFVSLQDTFGGLKLAQCIEDAVRFIKRCERCGGLSENEICDICADTTRDSSLLTIVESPKDILTFEQNGIYDGFYFVMEEVNEEVINKLKKTITINQTTEVIFAFTPGLNSDALMIYIEDKIKNPDIKFSKLAQGVPTGVSLENVDMLSLLKAFESRTKT
ncbi:recombination protein RecR [Campylobacter sp. RM9344]|uniref:Recombination protein RecR n=1 Tax=Campylobacter californiensis TaxID=1032243 RepID=A0AAW3ZUV7_9BACT|nr:MULTISPECIES: recombination mediator RecR [unclassified Campylobacter]MBE2985135.1 recombination protein RecR [Campylobacter sp. RM6883]MBE2986424.1 recombination protein RecR [Campylobacter sp. RM12919]MBE2988704.1 recombination protein RecR [Campylobacter sp. RM12920]MBE3030010.1 recombination protein RecR [Campylobacter sp. RM9344]MBE3605670.1 recombination protein RecR [Campylobacter sp. RM13119]